MNSRACSLRVRNVQDYKRHVLLNGVPGTRVCYNNGQMHNRETANKYTVTCNISAGKSLPLLTFLFIDMKVSIVG